MAIAIAMAAVSLFFEIRALRPRTEGPADFIRAVVFVAGLLVGLLAYYVR